MRVLQFPAPVKDLFDKGLDPQTLSYMHIPDFVLIDDGKGGSLPEMNPIDPNRITR